MSDGINKEGGLQRLLKGATHRFTKKFGSRAEKHSPGAEEIQAWLIERIARRLGIGMDEMHVREPLADYGMDSRAMLSLSGELEEWLGRRLSPTLVWDYPTIAELAAHLATDDSS